MMTKKLLISLIALTLSNATNAVTFHSDLESQSELTLTLYDEGFGLVEDTRTIPADIENNSIDSIRFTGISEQINQRSSFIEGANVKEKAFSHFYISHENMLEAMLNQPINIEHLDSGKKITAKLLSIDDNRLLLQTANKSILSHPRESNNYLYSFSNLPNKMALSPELTIKVHKNEPIAKNVKLTYLTKGLGWSADYTFKLKPNNQMDVSAWVTLENNTSTDYKNALVNLLFGDVVHKDPFDYDPTLIGESTASGASQSYSKLRRQISNIGGYKKHTLPIKTDLPKNQEKQVRIFDFEAAKYSTTYLYNVDQDYNEKTGKPIKNARIQIQFENTATNGLGIPMPNGIARFYESNKKAEHSFSGEGHLDDTAIGIKRSFIIGEAFDISVSKTHRSNIKSSRIFGDKEVKTKKTIYEDDKTIKITNSSAEPKVVKLIQPIHDNMKITKTNMEFLNEIGVGYIINVTVPARSDVDVKYTTLTEEIEQIEVYSEFPS